MAPVLSHLVNCSQKSGIFPQNGKIARVIPVYKNKGNKHHYVNYRPVSLRIKAALANWKKVVRGGVFLVFAFLVFEKSVVVAAMVAWAEAVQGQG